MNKEQSMSQPQKLPSIPVHVVRAFGPLEYSNTTAFAQDDEWFFKPLNRRKNHRFKSYIDASEIRDGFLAIRDVDDALRFFRETGYFFPLHNERDWGKDDIPKHPHVFATLSEIRRCQGMIRKIAISPLADWAGIAEAYPTHWCKHFGRAPTMHLHKDVSSGGVAIGVARCLTGLTAIVTLIQVDHLAGLEWRACARPDCPRVYRVESRHSRKFCSTECAHLVAVRASRARLLRKTSRTARVAQMNTKRAKQRGR
jgi:hypothetical protein